MSTLFTIPAAARAAQSPPRSRAEKAPAAPPARFVAGPENMLVRAVEDALAARQPAWNPIVLCGLSGLGKSLLLDLFSHDFAAAFPAAHVLATTGADYVRAFADACDADSVADFRRKFSRPQLLAIDDLHRLAGKQGAEQEFVHLLDALIRRGSLVICALRQSPLETPFSPMLQSRLCGGLVVPISVPQAETRRAMVKGFAAEQGLDMPIALLDRLAGCSPFPQSLVTAPQLRHAVLEFKQRARHEMRQATISEAWFDELQFQKRPQPRAVMKQIAAAVAKLFQLSVADLRGDTRRQSVVQPRNLAMHLCRRLTGASYAAIGEYFGQRDHTTVMHSCRKAAAELAASAPLARQLDGLAAAIAAEER